MTSGEVAGDVEGGCLGPDGATLPDARCRELFETALIGIYVARPDGSLSACNAAFARMLGFASAAEAVAVNLSDVYTASDQRDLFISYVESGGRLDHHRGRLRRRDGVMLDVAMSLVGSFDRTGGLAELRGFLMDVTARGDADAAQVDRERRFRSVFVDAADAMLVLDEDRRILEANRAAIAMFGAAIQALETRLLDDLFADGPEALASAWQELLAVGEARREHRLLGGGPKGPRLVECSYRAALQGRLLCIARDVTDRRQLEDQVLQSAKIESIGRLAGGIAHDFNNLLTAILGYTELLLANRGVDDPDREDLQEIQKAGQRAASLTRQLLAYGRKQVLMPKEVDLNTSISGLQTMLTRVIREDISLMYDLAPEPAVVRIDPTQLEQVILNLVLNSRDALPAGGFIRLEVAHVQLGEEEVPPDQVIRATDYVRLRVVDNGVGIAPAARAHLFEPFFTTKEVGKGTGLGLASVYGIVRQSNGFIAVDSEPEQGTTFTMHFPAVEGQAPEPELGPKPDAAASEPGRGTVLLVEDEDAVRVIVGSALRRQGYQVFEAATPSAACAVFDQHERDIDLLLSDVVMPEMSGPALAQRFVARRPELKILFISGYANLSSPLDAGTNVGFLGKPFQMSLLTAKLRDMLSRPPIGDMSTRS